MTIQYTFVFVLLVAEMLTLTVLLLPIPIRWRRSILRMLAGSPTVASLQYYLRYVFIFVLILFLDSTNRAFKTEQEEQMMSTGGGKAFTGTAMERHELLLRMFRSQRNMYLCGFTLFLMLVLSRFQSMSSELVRLDDQMKQSSKELNDRISDAKDLAELKSQLLAAKKKLDSKETELKCLVKQSESQHAEYMRLSDNYNELEKRIRTTKEQETKKDL